MSHLLPCRDNSRYGEDLEEVQEWHQNMRSIGKVNVVHENGNAASIFSIASDRYASRTIRRHRNAIQGRTRRDTWWDRTIPPSSSSIRACTSGTTTSTPKPITVCCPPAFSGLLSETEALTSRRSLGEEYFRVLTNVTGDQWDPVHRKRMAAPHILIDRLRLWDLQGALRYQPCWQKLGAEKKERILEIIRDSLEP